MGGKSHDIELDQTGAQLDRITRREFGLRAGALGGTLTAGSLLFSSAVAVASPTIVGGFGPDQVKVLAALLNAVSTPPSDAPAAAVAPAAQGQQATVVDYGLQTLARTYAGFDLSDQQELLARLSILEAGAPGGSFSALSVTAQQAFINTTLHPPVQTADLFPATLALYDQIQAAEIRAAAVVSPPPDPSDLEPDEGVPTSDQDVTSPPPFTDAEALAISIGTAVDFVLVALAPPAVPDYDPSADDSSGG